MLVRAQNRAIKVEFNGGNARELSILVSVF